MNSIQFELIDCFLKKNFLINQSNKNKEMAKNLMRCRNLLQLQSSVRSVAPTRFYHPKVTVPSITSLFTSNTSLIHLRSLENKTGSGDYKKFNVFVSAAIALFGLVSFCFIYFSLVYLFDF